MDKKWWTLIAVCFGTFMLLLDVTIVNVALPDIERDLGANLGDVQWVVDAYALTLASLLLVTGSLADRYGRRLVFSIGLVIFTLGSLSCGLSQNPLMLILSRAGQGIGGAMMFATSLALLASSFHGKERGTAFGVWGAITGVATAAGPILGGLITTGISWRGIFLVNVPIGVVALILTTMRVEETKASHAYRPDWLGAGLLTAGLSALVYGLIRASEQSWSDTGVYICLAAAVVLLACFVVQESRAEHPLFDLGLFRIVTFCGGSVAAVAMNGSLFAMLLYLVLYLQDVLGFSALGTGLRVAIMSVATLVAATAAGRLSAHMPVRWLIGPGLLIVGISLFVMGGLNATSSWTHLIPGFILGGIGAGMVNPPLASTAVGVVHPMKSGMASGVNNTFRQVGLAASIAALGSVFTAHLSSAVNAGLAPYPALKPHAGQIITAIKGGSTPDLSHVPAHDQAIVGHVVTSAFASGLNDLMIISGAIAVVGAVAATLAIRSKDFLPAYEPPAGDQAEAAAPEGATA